ncbi:MAG: diguanylate cyclase [Polyangiales bacterium]
MPTRVPPIEHLDALVAAQRELMAAALDTQRVMDLIIEKAAQLTQSTAVLEMREGDQMVYRAVSRAVLGAVGVRLDVRTSLSGRCVLEGRVLRSDDTEDDPRVDRVACRRVGARSMLCVPLFQDEQPVGVLKVYSDQPSYFDAQDVATVQLLAGFIAQGSASAVAHQGLYESELRFRSLAELASDAIVSADQRGLVTFWNDAAVALFGYTEAEILGRPFTALMPERYPLTQDMARGRFDPGRLEHVFGRPMELTGLRKDGSEFPVEIASSASMVAGERFFTSIIRDISERKRLEAAVLTLARTDHLTGLLNRRAGEEALSLELADARTSERELSLLMVDIDHFKRINDEVGHAGGDGVLRHMSEIIAKRIRGADIAVRWGGEEFLVVLPETTAAGMQGLGESLRAMVEEAHFPGAPAVTVSVGGATFTRSESMAEGIARADAKLYQAKREGRNCVRV